MNEDQIDPQQIPMNLTSPMHNMGSNIVFLTNPENELRKLELTLRNATEDANGEVIYSGEPLLNEEGIRSVIGVIQSIVSQVTIMSSLQDWEVESIGDFLADTLARDLMLNRIQYEINNPSSRDKIYFSALSTARITMNRGRNESDKKFWRGSQQEITTTINSDQNKKGFRLFPFGGR